MGPLGDVRATPLDALGLSIRTRNVLRRLGLGTLGDLAGSSSAFLLGSNCLGPIALAEIRRVLAAFGLALTGEPPPVGHEAEEVLAWFATFARAPGANLGMPLWVLDLCPKTRDWLSARQVRTVRELIATTEDDLWLLALEDELSLEEALEHFGEVTSRLEAFGLGLRASRPARGGFKPVPLPEGPRSEHPLDELPLRAQTVFRLRAAGFRTLGDLHARAAEAEALASSWPPGPRSEVAALLARLAPKGDILIS